MGHQQNRPMILLIQFMQKRHHLFTGFFIQVSRRFIAKQHLGIVDERPGNGNPLLLSAGKLSRIMLEPIHNAQPLGDLFKLCRLMLGQPCRKLNILLRRQLRQQVIKLKHKSNVPQAKLSKSSIPQSHDLLLSVPNAAGIPGIQSSQQVLVKRIGMELPVKVRPDL